MTMHCTSKQRKKKSSFCPPLHSFILTTQDLVVLKAVGSLCLFFLSTDSIIDVDALSQDDSSGSPMFAREQLDVSETFVFVMTMLSLVICRIIKSPRADNIILITVVVATDVIRFFPRLFLRRANLGGALSFNFILFTFTGLDFRVLLCLGLLDSIMRMTLLLLHYSYGPLILDVKPYLPHILLISFLPSLSGVLLYCRLTKVAELSQAIRLDPLREIAMMSQGRGILSCLSKETKDERALTNTILDEGRQNRNEEEKMISSETSLPLNRSLLSQPGWYKWTTPEDDTMDTSEPKKPPNERRLLGHSSKRRVLFRSPHFSFSPMRTSRLSELLSRTPRKFSDWFDQTSWRTIPLGPPSHWLSLGRRFNDPRVDRWYRMWAASFNERIFLSTAQIDFINILMFALASANVVIVEFRIDGNIEANRIIFTSTILVLVVFMTSFITWLKRRHLQMSGGLHVGRQFAISGFLYFTLSAVSLMLAALAGMEAVESNRSVVFRLMSQIESQAIVNLYIIASLPLRSYTVVIFQVVYNVLYYRIMDVALRTSQYVFVSIFHILLAQVICARPQDKNRRNLFTAFVLPVLHMSKNQDGNKEPPFSTHTTKP